MLKMTSVYTVLDIERTHSALKRVSELVLVVHLVLGGPASLKEGWKYRPVSVGRNCKEGSWRVF